jgi:hypothetical protein
MDYEDQDQISVNFYLKKANKLLLNLFGKYANTGIYRLNTLHITQMTVDD